jgi:hypothetical protein
MCLSAIYIFPGSVYVFPPAEQADPSWEYIIRSQTHECGNWAEAPIFLFWKYLFQIFGILSLQCRYSLLMQTGFKSGEDGTKYDDRKKQGLLPNYCPIQKFIIPSYS